MEISINEIAGLIDGEVVGDGTTVIRKVAKIEEADDGDITFLANKKYYKFLETSNASAYIVDKTVKAGGKNLIRVDHPYLAFLKVFQFFNPTQRDIREGIHRSAVLGKECNLGKNLTIGACVFIGDTCEIGNNTIIYPHVYLGNKVKIGENVKIYPHVTIREDCSIGNNVIIHAGTVIGSDGFGYVFEKGNYIKIPQLGNVVIEDDVEIGANCAIDRATMGSTRIKKGAKLDNLIHLAHNVEIGENTAIAAQAGISGSTTIGKTVSIGGQAGLLGHIKIGNRVKIGAQAGVTKSFNEEGITISGYPARNHIIARKREACYNRLPEMFKKIKKLEKKINNK